MKDLFGYGKEAAHPKNSSLLTTVYNNGELAFIRSILDAAQIPYFIGARGSGVAMGIIAGFNAAGMEIFVPDSMLDTAQQLIAPSDEQEPDTDGSESDGDGESD